MKFQKIVCLGFSGDELDDKYWEELNGLAEQSTKAPDEASLGADADADGLLVKLGAKVSKDLMDKMPNLKYIGMLGTGYGGIDTAYATDKGIIVTNIADYATEGVAEFTLGMLLEWYRGLSRARKLASEGTYEDDFPGVEIKGKTFGVIGLGHIGRRTAQLAKAFGADVYYWSKNPKNDAEDFKFSELDELLAKCDIITLNIAFNPESEGLINAGRVAKIKKDSVFINPSPMELIDFSALVTRLRHNDMTFMLDHSDEMTEDQLKALKPLNNAIIYPAIAYLTKEASQLKKRIYIDNIKNFLLSKPTNRVN